MLRVLIGQCVAVRGIARVREGNREREYERERERVEE